MKQRLIALLAIVIVKTLSATLRYHRKDRTGFRNPGPMQKAIWIFWHNRVLGMARGLRGPYRKEKGVVLTSASKDGEILARVIGSYGMEAARGSTSKRGSRAVLELKGWIERGYGVAITPDGPRGPRYKLAPGVIFLAQKTNLAIVPVHLNYASYWTLKSWDRFMIPKPFSRVEVIMDEPVSVKVTSTPEEFEAERLRIEKILNDGREDPF